MLKLDPIEWLVSIVLALILLAGLAWAVSPLVLRKNNDKAAEQIIESVEEHQTKRAEQSAQLNEKTSTSIQTTTRKYSIVAVKTADPDSGDEYFFSSLCDSRFYKTDPQCSRYNR